MPNPRVAIIAGDGIGPEVIGQARQVVRAAGVQWDETEFDLGAGRWKRTGDVLPDADLEALRGFDAILLGAVGGDPRDPDDVPPGILERGLLLKLRFELDLYINLRPFSSVDESGAVRELIVVREATEGSYAGEGGFLRKGTPHEVATQGSVNTRMGVERAIRYAFELASTRAEPRVSLVHKTNVLTFAGDLWKRAFDHVAAEYPQVTTSYDHVDACCIHMVERPERYDVIVTDNLFGDIITDLAGAVFGGLGLAASAGLNAARTGPSLFEPIHGSAPDIVGTDKVNPTAAIRSAAMLLDFIGDTDAADRIRKATDEVLATAPVPITIGALVAAKL